MRDDLHGGYRAGNTRAGEGGREGKGGRRGRRGSAAPPAFLTIVDRSPGVVKAKGWPVQLPMEEGGEGPGFELRAVPTQHPIALKEEHRVGQKVVLRATATRVHARERLS
jgi:hypothetical protein